MRGVEYSEYDPRQTWLPGVDQTYGGWPAPSRLAPLVRWAGGKRWLLPLIGAGIHKRLSETGGRIIEPFAGGAALSSWLGWPRTLLGDACVPLASLYAEVVVNADAVSDVLDQMIAFGYDRTAYYTVRSTRPESRVDFAAWCLYLNRTCFNGLWRENKSGQFNVPFGKLEHPAFPTRDHLRAWADRARDWEVHCGDFSRLVEAAGRGDIIFADPPYLDGTKGAFSGYVHGGWMAEDRARLALALGAAVSRGAEVIVTDGSSEAARADYEDAGLGVMAVQARHNIGASAERRGKVKEWIGISDQKLMGG